MGLAGIFVVVLIAVAVVAVSLWGIFEAAVRLGRFLWRLLTQP